MAPGVRTLGGFLAGGMISWRSQRREVATIARWTVEELGAREDDEVQIVDVRELAEWDEGHSRVASRALPRQPQWRRLGLRFTASSPE